MFHFNKSRPSLSLYPLLIAALLTGPQAAGQQTMTLTMKDARALALSVSGLQNEYIDIHNKFFELQNLGRPMDFTDYERRLSKVSLALVPEVEIADRACKSDMKQIRDFGCVMKKYGRLLDDAVTRLASISSKLNEAVKNPDSYSFERYQKEIAKYNEAREHFQALGADLNKAYRTLLDK
jgi:hypothetical protein